MSLNFWFTIVLVKCIIIGSTSAQSLITEPVSVPFISVHYGLNLSGADLNERFGFHSNAGIGLGYKTIGNWQFEIKGQTLFGQKVKEENIVDHLINEDGTITGNTGQPAEVTAVMRGFSIGVESAKLININKDLPNSGFMLKFGTGLLQHKIKYEDVLNEVPQFGDEYVQLFDRLSNGFYIRQSIGYQYFAKNRLLNYSIAFEIMEGFTASRRSYNFNANESETANRLDITYGIKFTWMLPFYKRSNSKKERYYTD